MPTVYAKRRDERVPILLDQIDVDRLGNRKLSMGSHGYAQMYDGEVLTVHSWIMRDVLGGRIPPHLRVDHKDRDPRNCQRANLRLVTPTENNLNRAVPTRELPLGVHRIPSGRYAARLKRNRRTAHLGTFGTPAEAAAARAAAVISQEETLVPSQSQIATIDKQITRAENELAAIDTRRDKAQAVIDSLPLLEEELRERISYLHKVRARKVAAGVVDAPVAAADDETPVLNTETARDADGFVVEDTDPRLTSAV